MKSTLALTTLTALMLQASALAVRQTSSWGVYFFEDNCSGQVLEYGPSPEVPTGGPACIQVGQGDAGESSFFAATASGKGAPPKELTSEWPTTVSSVEALAGSNCHLYSDSQCTSSLASVPEGYCAGVPGNSGNPIYVKCG